MNDITWCTSTDCPSKDCKIKLLTHKFPAGTVLSMADFSGTCRYYIGWLVQTIEDSTDKTSKAEERCSFCGGKLSEIRYTVDGKPYRYCYGCHFDKYIIDEYVKGD